MVKQGSFVLVKHSVLNCNGGQFSAKECFSFLYKHSKGCLKSMHEDIEMKWNVFPSKCLKKDIFGGWNLNRTKRIANLPFRSWQCKDFKGSIHPILLLFYLDILACKCRLLMVIIRVASCILLVKLTNTNCKKNRSKQYEIANFIQFCNLRCLHSADGCLWC